MPWRETCYAGIIEVVGADTYNNIQLYREGKISGSKFATDAVVDVGFGAGGIAASAAAGAAKGSVVPVAGTVAGAVVGFCVGLVYTGVTESWKPYGHSIKDRAKNALYNVVNR